VVGMVLIPEIFLGNAFLKMKWHYPSLLDASLENL
jgi:hypothetical protein